MFYLYIYLSMLVGAVCTLTAMRRREKHNIGKLGWLALILLTPPVGLILFVIFGGKKISAEHRVFVHSFIFIDDNVGRAIIDRLCEKARLGVEVRLMVDGFGSFEFPEDLLHRVTNAGGKTTRFKPLSKFSRFAYLNFRNHRKLVVADGARAMTQTKTGRCCRLCPLDLMRQRRCWMIYG